MEIKLKMNWNLHFISNKIEIETEVKLEVYEYRN